MKLESETGIYLVRLGDTRGRHAVTIRGALKNIWPEIGLKLMTPCDLITVFTPEAAVRCNNHSNVVIFTTVPP